MILNISYRSTDFPLRKSGHIHTANVPVEFFFKKVFLVEKRSTFAFIIVVLTSVVSNFRNILILSNLYFLIFSTPKYNLYDNVAVAFPI